MKIGAFAAALCFALLGGHGGSAARAAGHDDVAILRTVDALVRAMNAGNDRAIAALMTPDAVIQDEVAPYRWLSPNAEAKWSHDDGRLIVERGVTHTHSARGRPAFIHQTATDAYAAVPLEYTYRVNGRSQRETGLWTVVFTKTANQWRIRLLGFAKQSDTSDQTWNGR